LRTEGPGTEEDARKLGSLIEDSGNRLLSLVNDLLDLARAQSADFVLHRSPIDLALLAGHTATVFEPIAKQKEILLNVESAVDLPHVMGDASKINQVIGNVLSNSIKFTPRGGMVFLSLARTADNFIRVTVRDTGIGIPSADLGKIFDKFGLHQRTGTEGELGTGLGMPIVKRFVELHHGRIGLESREGAGTSLTIDFPIV
jgi:signal transduction histidine kinase